MKNVNQKDNFFKRLFKYFDNFLILDKSVDFVLIFIGLLTALMFENYISDKKAKDNYITYLSRVHVEMLTFEPSLEDRKTTFKRYDSLQNKMIENMGSKKYEDLDGYNEIELYEPRNLNTDIFRSINNEFFADKIINFESLHDVAEFFRSHGYDINIPVCNVTENKNLKLDRTMIQYVNKTFAADFKHFGYKFEE